MVSSNESSRKSSNKYMHERDKRGISNFWSIKRDKREKIPQIKDIFHEIKIRNHPSPPLEENNLIMGKARGTLGIDASYGGSLL